MAILPFKFAFHTKSSVCSVAAHTQKPSSCKRWMLCTMLDTCATGTCVMAPAELLYVEASTRALRLLGIIRPDAPTASQERLMAPRLPASVR